MKSSSNPEARPGSPPASPRFPTWTAGLSAAGLFDKIGVIGTLLQWVVLAWALYPGASYRRHGEATTS